MMAIVVDNRDERSGYRNRFVAFVCAAVVVGMIGVAYAAVPLYQIFCQVTGYGGTTQVGSGPANNILDDVATVRFDGNVMNGLKWNFRPAHGPVEIRIGETKVAYYKATNQGGTSSTGTAVFNVTPLWAGQYFVKIECFCFTEQTLAPGETVDMPVQFYVDPAIVDDEAYAGLDAITLSYTFFANDSEAPANVSSAAFETIETK